MTGTVIAILLAYAIASCVIYLFEKDNAEQAKQRKANSNKRKSKTKKP